jgi:Rrf2 family protein
MKLSKKSDYALRALVYLAINHPHNSVQIKEIATREKLPTKFLENILLSLRKAGLLYSKMGLKGGYALARPPDKITMGEVVRVLDGTLAPISCVSLVEYERCSEETTCAIRSVMQDVRNAVTKVLDETTLADLCKRVRKIQEHTHPPALVP